MGNLPAATQERWERVLRQTVRQFLKCNKPVVVNQVRAEAETKIEGIDPGFFRAHEVWKEKSKEIIGDEFEKVHDGLPSSGAPSPVKKAPVAVQKTGKSMKRKSDESTQKPEKRKKIGKSKEVEEEEEEEEEEQEKNSASDLSSSAEESVIADITEDPPSNALEDDLPEKISNKRKEISDEQERHTTAGDASESEMSVLVDEDPKPKKQQRKSDAKSTKEPTRRPSKAKALPPDADPQAEEIKLLQRRLVKCGIRKMWFKELAPYDTAKAKIRHLNDMLKEAGITGRYSDEKAAKIREERELKQDLEAVQEGNKKWGQEEDSEPETEKGRPKRKLAKGLAEIQYLVDDGPTDDDEW